MDKGSYLSAILRSSRTVFSFKDIALLWDEAGTNAARVRINYYVKTGALIRLRRGLYAKDKNYSEFELGTKIFTPSYISFETVLTRSGINFQFYGHERFVASYLTREVRVGEWTFNVVKIKDFVLTDDAGIEHKDNYSIATAERAFLDVLYRSKDYHFDNMGTLNWEKVFELMPIYRNATMEKTVRAYHKNYLETL